MGEDVLVHVIDDDEAMRDSLEFLIASDGLTARSYASAASFLASEQIGNGCVVTDVRMPEMSGIELIRAMSERGICLPVIVVTGHGDVAVAVEAMKAGALDFLEKPFEDRALLAAVRAALTSARAKEEIDSEKAIVQERLALLSARERQVLDGVVAGRANKVIAVDLGISPRTVEVYRANVMSKMQAAGISELVRMMLRAGGP
ncbi:MAG: response regulator [Alphaproteobacteria bacterium]|nr:response regulator [Alphaproteobacteria bacterium]